MHKAKAVIITCMDFRFHRKIEKFLKENEYIGKYDKITIAGGSRDFIKPIENSHGEYVWRQLELSIKLHNPDEIIFIDHQDCGGYAQDGLIKAGIPLAADKSGHTIFLKKLKQKLLKKFPGKILKFMYIPLGDAEEIKV